MKIGNSYYVFAALLLHCIIN